MMVQSLCSFFLRHSLYLILSLKIVRMTKGQCLIERECLGLLSETTRVLNEGVGIDDITRCVTYNGYNRTQPDAAKSSLEELHLLMFFDLEKVRSININL